MTEAERIFDPGPGWRKATVYDRPLPTTYIKVIAGSTQQFWVPDGDRGIVAGDRVKFSSPYGDQGYGMIRVVHPERVLVVVDATESRGASELWLAPTSVERVPDEEEIHD